MGAPSRHPKGPARLEPLAQALERHGVVFVITGSVAEKLHGMELEHGDLDIVPETSPENLARLARVLAEIEGAPDTRGHWEATPEGRRRWIVEDDSDAAAAGWVPDPADPSTFDHRFRTRFGDFDVVPELTGRYDALSARATVRRIGPREVRVAHVDDLLAALDRAGRPKHVERAKRLRERTGG